MRSTNLPGCFPDQIRGALFFIVLMVFALGAVTSGAGQDKKKEPLLKTVHGQVLDKADKPISGAIVFLKNLQNKTVKSSFSDDDGQYRFSGLDPNTDYEIHAEFKDDSSATRRLSALDGRKDVYLNLFIVHKK
jgi:hypothetical protein